MSSCVSVDKNIIILTVNHRYVRHYHVMRFRILLFTTINRSDESERRTYSFIRSGPKVCNLNPNFIIVSGVTSDAHRRPCCRGRTLEAGATQIIARERRKDTKNETTLSFFSQHKKSHNDVNVVVVLLLLVMPVFCCACSSIST